MVLAVMQLKVLEEHALEERDYLLVVEEHLVAAT